MCEETGVQDTGMGFQNVNSLKNEFHFQDSDTLKLYPESLKTHSEP